MGDAINKIQEDIEKEKSLENSRKLTSWSTQLFNRQIKETSNRTQDDLFIKYLNENPLMDDEAIYILRQYNNFLKENN